MSRGKKAIKNTAFSFLMEIAEIISALVVPRLILANFGSEYNGVVNSVAQFLAAVSLLRTGIGGATRAALYKPLAENDTGKINAIMSATNRFMKKVALIIVFVVLALAVTYPFIVAEEFDWLFTFSLILIIGLEKFVDAMFGLCGLTYLQARQENYIACIIKTISAITNILVVVLLVRVTKSIHVIKLGTVLAISIYPVCMCLFVRYRHHINYKAKPDNNAIKQRWDVFFHQIATFVMNNTGMVILTLFSNLITVSIYSVYNLISNGIHKLVYNVTNGLEGAFGSMIAKKEKQVLKNNFITVEYLLFFVSTVVYAIAMIMILPFVSLYTAGVTDAEYVQPLFAFLLVIAQFFLCIRQPYQLLMQAAGHYKQTKRFAIAEPIINICISVAGVICFGLVGVVIGMLAAVLYRTGVYVWYVSRNFISGTIARFLKLCAISAVQFFVIIVIYNLLPLKENSNYFIWCINSLICGLVAMAVLALFSAVFFRNEAKLLTNKLKTALFKRERRR